MDDLDREQLLRSFTAESFEGLATLEQTLLLLEHEQGNTEHLNTIFRIAHSLKGNALCLGFENIGTYTDRLEDYLERLRDGSVRPSSEAITRLLRVTDAIRDWLPDVLQGDEAIPEQCSRALNELFSSNGDVAERIVNERPVQGERSLHGSQTVRLEIGKLDRLLDLTMELMIACGRINAALGRLPANLGEGAGQHGEVAEQLGREMNELVLRARMVPVGSLFRQYTRVVRDASRELDKSARLVIEGADVEIDAAVLEHLRDPLTHLVRNAIDHGIEASDERAAAGKDVAGTVTLSARQEGRTVLVTVCDDGRGLDEERILARARESGGQRPEDIRQLIFEPGFTTAEEVTKISGRGVGLDVVKANIEAIRGEISVSSTPGRGMTMAIRLPLTVTVIEGLIVRAGGETYVVPLESMVECTALPSEARAERAAGVLAFRDAAVPFGRLGSLVGSASRPSEHEGLLVVRHQERLAGIVVDEIAGKEDVVMKPLDDWYTRVPFVSGSTILSDGRIALILDVRAALQVIERTPRRTAAA